MKREAEAIELEAWAKEIKKRMTETLKKQSSRAVERNRFLPGNIWQPLNEFIALRSTGGARTEGV
jgi:hypothetical protein